MNGYIAAVAQVRAAENREENLRKAGELIREAARLGAKLVVLPEDAAYVGPDAPDLIAEPLDGPYCARMSALASELGIWLYAGSFPEENGTARPYNTAPLFGPDGRTAALYRKLHMFDGVAVNGRVSNESAKRTPGSEIVVADTALGSFGLSVCYDIRFPEMFRAMALRGAQAFLCGARFAMQTGKDHWEPLLRARAIENGCYVIAAGQIGTNHGFTAYGKSMIIDPWGDVIACCGEGEGIALAGIDPARAEEVRDRLPSLKNRRSDVYGGPGR